MKRVIAYMGWALIGAMLIGYAAISLWGNELETCGDPLTAMIVEVDVSLDVNRYNARSIFRATVEFPSGTQRPLQPTSVPIAVGNEIIVQRMCYQRSTRVGAYRLERVLS